MTKSVSIWRNKDKNQIFPQTLAKKLLLTFDDMIPKDGKWHHLLVVMNDDFIEKAYIDGKDKNYHDCKY